MNRETLIEGGGYGPWNGGYGHHHAGNAVGGWVAGGIAFLFIVFLVVGFAMFAKTDAAASAGAHGKHEGEAHADALADARFQGACTVREETTLAKLGAINERVENLEIGVTRGFDATVAAIQASASGIINFGQNQGFRNFGKVFPDPCCDPCAVRADNDGGSRRHRGLELGQAALSTSFTQPSTTTVTQANPI
jgi:hypothetical protein